MRTPLKLLPAILVALIFSSCATTKGPNPDLRKKANDLCWKIRDELKDWEKAVTECVKRVQNLDGVESAHAKGALVKVKFEDSSDEYGIWLK